MSVSAIRSSLYLSRLFSTKKTFLSNCFSKTSFSVSQANARTIARSLFVLCRKRKSDSLSLSNKFSCSCGMHTKGDKELAAFLEDEIETERKAQRLYDEAKLDGFQCGYSGSDVTLTKKYNNEMITIKSNVNNSVDAEETVTDPNETKEPQESEMKAKPEFTIEIKKGKKTLSFHCTYNHAMPEEETDVEPYNDTFQISEVALYEGEFDDSTYVVSGEIMDGYLYDLLMNYLEERGISNDFADKMIVFFTSYEHQLYISLLQGMKSFVEK